METASIAPVHASLLGQALPSESIVFFHLPLEGIHLRALGRLRPRPGWRLRACGRRGVPPLGQVWHKGGAAEACAGHARGPHRRARRREERRAGMSRGHGHARVHLLWDVVRWMRGVGSERQRGHHRPAWEGQGMQPGHIIRVAWRHRHVLVTR
jgi:hypothetical protein